MARLDAGKLESSICVSSAWSCVLHQLGTELWVQELVRSDGTITSRRGGRFFELYTVVGLVTRPALLCALLTIHFHFIPGETSLSRFHRANTTAMLKSLYLFIVELQLYGSTCIVWPVR